MRPLGEKRSAIEKKSKFGPGLERIWPRKKMEAFGKDIEAKFGSGSDFDKKMEAFGKEIEAKFGPGLRKKMKALSKEIEEVRAGL